MAQELAQWHTKNPYNCLTTLTTPISLHFIDETISSKTLLLAASGMLLLLLCSPSVCLCLVNEVLTRGLALFYREGVEQH